MTFFSFCLFFIKKQITKPKKSWKKEDLAFFFDGERFISGIEKIHAHEQNNELTQKVRKVHQELAQKHEWIPINANASIEEIHVTIKNIIINKFNLQATV